MTHTKEPWVFRHERQGNRVRRFIRSTTSFVGDIACAFSGTTQGRSIKAEEAEANAARIVSCVNALAGLNPDAVADVVAALEHYAKTYCEGYGECVGDLCGKFTPEECGGCKAYAALARIRGEG